MFITHTGGEFETRGRKTVLPEGEFWKFGEQQMHGYLYRKDFIRRKVLPQVKFKRGEKKEHTCMCVLLGGGGARSYNSYRRKANFWIGIQNWESLLI